MLFMFNVRPVSLILLVVADISPALADLTTTPGTAESPVVTFTHLTPNVTRLVPSDRRRTIPSTTCLTNSFPCRSTDLRSSFPPSFSRTQGSHIIFPTNSIANALDGVPPAVNVLKPNISDSSSIVPGESMSVVSKTSSIASLVPVHSRFTSLTSRSYIPSYGNHTHSTRTSVSQRLRPDNSWIVPPGGHNGMLDADSTNYGTPPAHRLRAISSICLNSSGVNGASSGTVRGIGEANGDDNIILSSFKCFSIVSGPPSTSIPPKNDFKSSVNQSHKTLQLCTSPCAVPVSVEPVHLSRLTENSGESRGKQSIHPNFCKLMIVTYGRFCLLSYCLVINKSVATQ